MRLTELFVIEEARREPARNIRYTPADIINRYANRDDVFVHFSNTPKLGINPKSHYNTPMGLYSYPVKYVADAISRGERTLHKRVPFMSEAEYVTIFKETGDITNLCDYNHAKDLMERFELLVRDFLEQKGTMIDSVINHELDRMKRFGKQMSRVSDIEGGELWGQMYYILDEFFNSSTSSWARMFQKMDVDCVVDFCGAGIIHPSEPVQAIHFNPQKTIEVIEMMENRGKSNITPSDIDFDPSILDGEGRVKTLRMASPMLNPPVETIVGVGINGFIKSIGIQESKRILTRILSEYPQYVQKHAAMFEMDEEDFLNHIPSIIIQTMVGMMGSLKTVVDEDKDSDYYDKAWDHINLIGDIYTSVLKSAVQQLYTQAVVDILDTEKPDMISLRLGSIDFEHVVITLDNDIDDMKSIEIQSFVELFEKPEAEFYDIDGGVDLFIPQKLIIDKLIEKPELNQKEGLEITDVKVNWLDYSGIGSNIDLIMETISGRMDEEDAIVERATSFLNLNNI